MIALWRLTPGGRHAVLINYSGITSADLFLALD